MKAVTSPALFQKVEYPTALRKQPLNNIPGPVPKERARREMRGQQRMRAGKDEQERRTGKKKEDKRKGKERRTAGNENRARANKKRRREGENARRAGKESSTTENESRLGGRKESRLGETRRASMSFESFLEMISALLVHCLLTLIFSSATVPFASLSSKGAKPRCSCGDYIARMFVQGLTLQQELFQ
eukprot:Skav222450  [mRNA]  locus=scaffold1150:77962:78525:+ [translate_table: standard]